MNLPLIIVVFGACILKVSTFHKLPPYIKLCSRQDPNFNDCFIKNGNEAIPALAEGFSPLHIPRLDPLYFDSIDLQPSPNLKLYAKNTTLYNLKNCRIKDADWDFEKQQVMLVLNFPFASQLATYKIKGRLLLLNLDGEGTLHFNFTNLNTVIHMHYDLITKSAIEYARVTNIHVNFTLEKLDMYLSNLVNNEEISEKLNMILNENWREFINEIDEAANLVIENIINLFVSRILENVPFNEIVKP